ncbi:MFS transporter [Hyphomicrobium sp.]|uniref:MFS transporter n=1 Tax=Hyphomicrobium sp. TaxID=82 RepID=UPI0025C41DE6|nr:MFS transporter [Hyphomicrobium sp.]MCC7251003.1 MFS transporter [Hyphomicrobium sp.]
MDTSVSSSSPHPPSAFTYRSFRLYWLARFLNGFATQIISVAVGWQIYDETRNAFLLGLVGLVQFAPAIVFVLVTGTVADRYNRRTVMGLATTLEALCVAALAAFWLVHAGRAADPGVVWPVFVILTLFGVARAFLTPAVQSLAANLVPRESFPNAVAWNSSAMQASFTIGPAVGGLLYGISSLVPYAVAFLLFGAAATLTLLIPKPQQRTSSEPRSIETMLAGFRYIRSNPVVLGAISLDMFAVLLGGATALLPVFARDILEVGPWGLGFLRSAAGVGALVMVVWLVRHPIPDHAGKVMFASVAVYGLAILLFGLSTTLWLSLPALFIMGAADMVSVNVRASLIQLATPDDLRGRVTAVNSVFIGASNEVGEFRAGTMAALIGAVPAVVIGGAGTLAITALWTRLFPALYAKRKLT